MSFIGKRRNPDVVFTSHSSLSSFFLSSAFYSPFLTRFGSSVCLNTTMAKWGEGDPRWIVEDRPDATNVNNWHWTEKNASQWSKEKLTELLNDLVIEGDAGSCRITEVSKIEGEASANNRKAKLIFFYEWNITLEWKGFASGDTEEVKGKLEIPNLSEENDPSEIDVNVSCKHKGSAGEKLKQFLRTKGTEIIRGKMAQYVKELKEEFTVGMILPNKDAVVQDGPKAPTTKTKTTPTSSSSSSGGSSAATTSDFQRMDLGGVNTTEITLKQSFKCTAKEFYDALTIKEMVEAFTRGPCLLEVKKGGRFEMFGGNVTGNFLQLVPHELVEMKWRFSGWPQGHHSVVRLSISQKEDSTEVQLSQKGVPVSDLDRTKSGWMNYYWESMKKTFGFGAMLF